MADWRSDLRPASFRGVPFYVAEHRASGGRRGQSHEFGGRDEPYREDLGRRARSWNVQAYVIGDDYMDKRDALFAALEAFGPGELIHPWLGRIKSASVPTYDEGERSRKNGFASFTITFEETGEIRYPSAAVNRRAAVADAADLSALMSVESFTTAFSVEGKPAFVLDDAAKQTTNFLTDIQKQVNSVRAEVAPVWSAINQIGGAIDQVSTLARTPALLAGQVRGVIQGFASLIPSGFGSFRSLLNFSLWGEGAFGLFDLFGSTPNRVQVSTNQAELVRLVRRVATAEAAIKLTEDGFDDTGTAAATGIATGDSTGTSPSLQDALGARDEVLTAIDAEIASAGARNEHDVFVAFGSLRTETIRFINEEAAQLPSLRSWTPPATLPASVIAYRLYDDATRSAETAARNGIRHPGFVPGGEALQVLDA